MVKAGSFPYFYGLDDFSMATPDNQKFSNKAMETVTLRGLQPMNVLKAKTGKLLNLRYGHPRFFQSHGRF